jgi:hypothetical protein
MLLIVAHRPVAYRSNRDIIPAEICEFLWESQSARLRVGGGAVAAGYLVDALKSHVYGCRVCADLVGVVRVYRFVVRVVDVGEVESTSRLVCVDESPT